MKRVKRNREERAYAHGFKAGVRGASADQCPYMTQYQYRGAWFAGWRVGREQYLLGGFVEFRKTG